MAKDPQNVGVENKAAVVPKDVTFTAVKSMLFVEGAKVNEAVQFYKTAFGAEEVSRTMSRKKKADEELPHVISVELKIGSVSILVSGLAYDSPVKSPGAGSVFWLMTKNDVEDTVLKVVGTSDVTEVVMGKRIGACKCSSGLCGGYVAKLKDPFGNIWLICSAEMKCANIICTGKAF